MAERKTLLLRIAPELWEDLSRWAGEELRSVNGQIEWILTRAIDGKYGSPGPGRGEGDLRRRSRASSSRPR
jgi:hypothetical protein